jgi:hypothetical protein
MVEYFKRVEKNLPMPNAIEEPQDKTRLSTRTSLFKINACNQKKISNVLAELANDDMVGNLNSAQKMINKNKSSVNVEILAKFVSTLDSFAGKSPIQDLIVTEVNFEFLF